MSQLPMNWTLGQLSQAAHVVRGITFPAGEKRSDFALGYVCCLRTTNVQQTLEWSDVYYVPTSYVKRDDQIVREGDVLMSMANSYELVGKVARADSVPQRAAFGAFLAAVRPTLAIDGGYLYHFLRSSEAQSKLREGSSQTTNIANISAGRLSELPVPLAPLEEQKRIADKLDTVLTRVDAVNTRLARVAPLLKRFRQSVLAAATSGRLTEDWRPMTDLSPMTEEVLTATRLGPGCSTKDARITGELIERGCHLSPNKLIPTSWICTCIGMIGVVSNGSTPSRSEPSYWGGAIPWVSSGEVRNTRVGATKECISQLGFESSSVKLLPAGSVLIAMIGEGKTRGQSGLLAIAATINQNIAAVMPNKALIESEYLWFWFQSQYEANRVAGNGTGPQALNCQKVRELPLNLPPLQEQTEIVRRVETLFAFADRLEARLQAAQTAADRLTPSLLAKAFRGELVPQDPNDEPASELLKRLAATAPSSAPKRGRAKAVKAA